ncbi:MAG TPA: PaaI family thioesterase [Thermomicrobiales bacterium]|nr:PaaI family thioesterase [Thermomicrobiales bacterium]
MGDSWDATVAPINEDTVGHHCFGCGSLNPIGLRLRFRTLDDGGVWTEFTPTREHEGYLGMVHGGITATLLDEAMNWAVTNEGDIAVTARMAVTYRQPLEVGQAVRVTAALVQRRSRAIETRAEIRRVDSGELLAEADGRFVRVSAAQAMAWREAYGAEHDDSTFADAARRTASSSR